MIRKIKLVIMVAVVFVFFTGTSNFAEMEDSNRTISGDYQFSSSLGGVQLQNTFEYRDDCFTRSSYLGCKHLESLSIQVAASSISFYSQEQDKYEIATEDNAHNVIDFLTKMEFDDIETNQYYKTEKHENSVGVCVGHKTIMQEGNSYTLLAIVPRSAGYKQEWAGNFKIGDGDIHEGFKATRDEILRFVKQYITKNGIEGRIKVWISGYSRGAAISDMLGGFFAGGGIDYFEDVVSITPEDVYCYTIGTPRTIKDGLDKNVELSVGGKRDETEYQDDTEGEEFIYTKGGKVTVGDEIYGGLRNLISVSDTFPLLPPEEWGFTHYGNRIDPTDGLSSIEDALKELKSISEYVYDIYTENDERKELKLKTFDLKTLSIVDKGKSVNPAAFMKEKVDGLAHRIGSNKDYNEQHYQDGLKSALGAYGLLAPVVDDVINDADINSSDAIKTLLYTYVAYVSEYLQEQGVVHDEKEATMIIIADLLEHFLEMNVDTQTLTIDDLFANVAKYLADNMEEPVGQMAIAGILDSIPEEYRAAIISSFSQFHKDYYSNRDTYEVNPDITKEEILAEFIKACAYGADPECTAATDYAEPGKVRGCLYMLIAMTTSNTYPEIPNLLFDDNYEAKGQGLVKDAVDLFMRNLLIDKDEEGNIIQEYESISQLADEALLNLLNSIQNNAVDTCKEIYSEEYSVALEYEIDGLKNNITEVRKAISTLLFYQSGEFDTVASLESTLSFVSDAMTVAMSHLDEVYLAYSRTSERYENHVSDYHEVRFELDKGKFLKELDNPIKVQDGEYVVEPENPTKSGYRFNGWYMDNQFTTQFDFDTPITEDVVLYAKWRRIKVSSGGGSSSSKSKGDDVKPQEMIHWGNASEWAMEELTKANEKGLIPSTFEKKDFTKAITRKEFAAVAVKLYEAISGNVAEKLKNNPFTDTNDEYVWKAYELGITKGISETLFMPDAEITREQMATMMTRALSKAGIDTKVDIEKVAKFDDDNEMHDWGKASVYYMSNIDIIKGMGNNEFGVLGNATREQSLLISVRSAQKFSRAK